MRIDTGTYEWKEVLSYCEKRVKEMTEECISPSTPDSRRAALANRIDELRDLMAEPTKVIPIQTGWTRG